MMSDFEVRRRTKDPLAMLPFEIGTELLAALRNAVDLESPPLFIDVVLWARSVLLHREVESSALPRALDALQSKLPQHVRVSEIEAARQMLAAARNELALSSVESLSEIDTGTDEGKVARRFLDFVLAGDEQRAAREVLIAFARGMKTLCLYQDVLVPVLRETGRMWQHNEISISQEHIITASVQRLMAQLIDFSNVQPQRDLSVASAALGPSQHAVGARMVSDAFALCGWQSHYLGSMIPAYDILEYVDRVSIDVLALSVTLSRDIAPLRDLIAELEKRPIAPIVIAGGRALSLDRSLWRKVGADGYAQTPLMAVALANELVAHADSR